MIRIKRRVDDAVLFEFNESNGFKDGMTIRDAAVAAVAYRANLSGANLIDADLSGAKF